MIEQGCVGIQASLSAASTELVGQPVLGLKYANEHVVHLDAKVHMGSVALGKASKQMDASLVDI